MSKELQFILGLCALGGVIYLSFVNWQASIVVLLVMIVANLGSLNVATRK